MRQADDHPWRDGRWRNGRHLNSRRNLQLHPENLTEKGEVDNRALRKAVKRSGLSKCEVARRLNFIKQIPDLYRLDVMLGLKRNSRGTFQKKVTYKMALSLCEAIGGDYHECGV